MEFSDPREPFLAIILLEEVSVCLHKPAVICCLPVHRENLGCQSLPLRRVAPCNPEDCAPRLALGHTNLQATSNGMI